VSKTSSQGEILKRHLAKLKRQNPKFSMRALAQRLDISHSFVTRIFSGKANIPVNLLKPLAEALKMDEFEVENLKRALAVEKAGIYLAEQALKDPSPESDPKEYVQFPESYLIVMRKWWNFAILDLLTCQMGIKFTADLIESFLPISESEIKNSLAELEKLGLIENINGHYTKINKDIRFPTRGPNPHTREFYRQGLSLAAEQLKRTSSEDFEKRLIMGISCAANSKNIPAAKQRLAAALRECALMLAEGECDDVFFVQGQLFSVLKKNS
jgi:uncharacterized protein (TIGR02147 family)